MLLTGLDVAIDVGRHFDALGIVWLVGGSVASSLVGEPRASADIDLVADLREPHIAELHRRLADAYYVDEDTAHWRAMMQARRSFNVLHKMTITKVDIFCAKDDHFAREELARRITIEAQGHSIPVSSAEDTVVQKLLWFEKGRHLAAADEAARRSELSYIVGRADRPCGSVSPTSENPTFTATSIAATSV